VAALPTPRPGAVLAADRFATAWSPPPPASERQLLAHERSASNFPVVVGERIPRQAGFTQFWRQWIPHLRDRIEATLNVVGAEKPFGRDAVAVDRADGDGTLASRWAALGSLRGSDVRPGADQAGAVVLGWAADPWPARHGGRRGPVSVDEQVQRRPARGWAGSPSTSAGDAAPRAAPRSS